jgi:hypothetical protein
MLWLVESPKASGALNDRIEGSRSGKAEWLRFTKSNNSFNRSADCVSFIIILSSKVGCCSPRPVNSGVRWLFLQMEIISMNDVNVKRVNVWTAIGTVGYVFGISPTLEDVFEDVFPRIIAFGLALFITFLSLYPIFIRGVANLWTKDKRPWTFPHWAILAAIITVLISIFLAILRPKLKVG